MSLLSLAANVVFPGSGFVVGLLRKLKPLLPWILGALLLLGAYLFVDHRGYARGAAERTAHYQPIMERALKRINLAKGSIVRLRGAIDLQNQGIVAHAALEKQRLAEAQRLLAEARKRDASRQKTIDRLRASATEPLTGPRCEPTETVKDLWK